MTIEVNVDLNNKKEELKLIQYSDSEFHWLELWCEGRSRAVVFSCRSAKQARDLKEVLIGGREDQIPGSVEFGEKEEEEGPDDDFPF